jgi:alpha-L-fucosidase
MKKFPLLSFLLILFVYGFAQTNSIPDTQNKKMEWWREARFGMFIHWGVYAVPAGVYHGEEQKRGGAEWIMNRMKIPVNEYLDYAKQFNPVKFNADAWVKMAKDAGMKYIVITAKHHDGFAIFKTNASKWNIVDATPYGKDILNQLAAACKKSGIKLGFYYSQAQDWTNPGGSAARKPAIEGWPNPDSTKIDAYTKEHNGHWDALQTTATMAEYIEKVSVPQVKELLTNYGDVSILWWDTPTNMTDEFAEKFKPLLKLQPNIITNDRLKRPNYSGDYKTPEQKIPNLSELDGKDWETCMTMNGTWGYRTSDQKWKSSQTLIRNLIDIASKGGNYLLNIGPKADGEFPQESINRLKEIGTWMKIYGEAIYGTHANPLEPFDWGRCTTKEINGNTTLYLSVFTWPKDGKLMISGINIPTISAGIIGNTEKVQYSLTNNILTINLPQSGQTNQIATVIKIVLKGKMKSTNTSEPTKKMKTGELD